MPTNLATATELAATAVNAASAKSFDPAKPLPVSQSLLASLVGILVVFAGLIILIVLIMIMAKATANMGKKKEAPKPAAAPAPAPVVEEVAEEEDNSAVVAAIMAAITCMMADENKGFVVKHVRRVTNAPAWQKAGRERTIANRF